jgi:hypothetical protein
MNQYEFLARPLLFSMPTHTQVPKDTQNKLSPINIVKFKQEVKK